MDDSYKELEFQQTPRLEAAEDLSISVMSSNTTFEYDKKEARFLLKENRVKPKA